MAAPKEELFPGMPSLVKMEAPLDGAGGFLELVEISSSGESNANETFGEEATSPALPVTPLSGKRTSSAASLEVGRKKPRLQMDEGDGAADLPADFLEPLEPEVASSALALLHPTVRLPGHENFREIVQSGSKQFWKAGNYDSSRVEHNFVAGGMDHVRVHPKFLHSNATSHKWALGAIAELLDNALDEAVNGATMAKVDMVRNPRDGRPMLMIEDNGGGMDPERMRQCMSLGYSAKSKIANTIGQYGNGFKTSTMRLGADVVVFSRSPGKDGSLPTQSIGMLSYTFLTATGQEDIIVPMIDYEVQRFGLRKLIRGTLDDWNKNMETILQWCPYGSEQVLLDQLHRIKHQGTIVVVYNLWEDEQADPELDFDTDPYDIHLRGTNRDEKNISMARKYPNCKHYFTYRYSLRSYASILYLRLPKGFKMILRGKEVKHHNLVHDLMLTQELTYRPKTTPELAQKDSKQMMAVVTIGFLKDAKEHIDVQGFNVYHKNRLIKPFWKVWNLPGIQGRGIVGVLEANFVEPAHDKQGFERTIILARLEARLLEIQKMYWSKNCQEVGYVNPSLKRTTKSAQKGDPVRDDQVIEKSNQAVTEVSLSVTGAVNSVSNATQTHLRARPSKMHEVAQKTVSTVRTPFIPLALRQPLVSEIAAQAQRPVAATETSTIDNVAALPTPPCRQGQLENHAWSPPAVTRSLRSAEHQGLATAPENNAVHEQTDSSLKTGAASSQPPRQISASTEPNRVHEIEAMATSIDGQESLSNCPLNPLAVARQTPATTRQNRAVQEQKNMARSLRSAMKQTSTTVHQNHAVHIQIHSSLQLNAGTTSISGQASAAEIPLVSNVPASSVPLSIREASGSEAQASTGTAMAHELEPVPTPADMKEPFQKCSVSLSVATESLSSRMHQVPTKAPHNPAVHEHIRTTLEPKARVPLPRKQTSAIEDPTFSSGMSMAPLSQACSTPTSPDYTETPIEMPPLTTRHISVSEGPLTPSGVSIGAHVQICCTSTLPDYIDATSMSTMATTCAEIPAELNKPPSAAAQLTGAKSLISQLLHDTSEETLSTLIPPSPQSVMLKASEFVSAKPLNLSPPISKDSQLQQKRPTLRTRSLVQFSQGCSELCLRTESAKEPVIESGTRNCGTDLNSIGRMLPNEPNASNSASGMPGLMECNDRLNAMKQKLQNLQRDLDEAAKERDSLKAQLQEERRRKDLQEEELQKRIQMLMSRARELEVENAQIQVL